MSRFKLTRVPFLAAALVALGSGVWGGLVRLQWPLPLPGNDASWISHHGPLLITGFLGTVISLERAVASGEASACYLEWTAGDRKGERVPLAAARTSFGRRDSNTVVLADQMASSHHAEIVRDLNGYTIRDLGSTNGTLVNGPPVTETALTHGARVRIVSGPLKGVEGMIEDPRSPKGVVISMDVLQQGVLVAVPLADLKILPS